MLVNEKGTLKALNEAWKKGYEIVPATGGFIYLYADMWALEIQMRDMPLEVSQALVQHYGSIPVEAEYVQKGQHNQMMMEAEVDDRIVDLKGMTETAEYIHKIPILFRDNWQLFVTEAGRVLAYDQKYLDMIDWVHACPDMMVAENGVGSFVVGGERLMIAPGKFGAEDMQKLRQIAAMYKDQRVTLVEIPENLCLFDDMEREE